MAGATPQAAITVPGAPSGLTASAGDAWINLSWTAPTGGGAQSGYKIFRDTTTGVSATGTPLTTVANTETAYQDTTVTNDTTYWYEVVAYNAAGDGPPSNEASATPTGGGVAAIPLRRAT